MRLVVLDTETTGLDPKSGHRIIEIGAVEILGRRLTGRHYHQYVNPERRIDAGAQEVHGISNEFLDDKPRFSAIADEFLEFVTGAELIIHNAAFDMGFLNNELRLNKSRLKKLELVCEVTDSLAVARHKHPGQSNSLDALCRRYGVDNSSRTLHGALLDAEILADVYLLMTGGQTALFAQDEQAADARADAARDRRQVERPQLPVVLASVEEVAAHEAVLDGLDKAASEGQSLWRKLAEG